jgi:hypothetical protein
MVVDVVLFLVGRFGFEAAIMRVNLTRTALFQRFDIK